MTRRLLAVTLWTVGIMAGLWGLLRGVEVTFSWWVRRAVRTHAAA